MSKLIAKTFRCHDMMIISIRQQIAIARFEVSFR